MSILDSAVSTVEGAAKNLLGDGSTVHMPSENPNAKAASDKQLSNASLLDPSISGDLSSYSTGTLKPGQAAAVDATTQAQLAQARQAAANSGTAGSTIEQSQENQIQNQSLMMTQQFLQGNYDDALRGMGLETSMLSSVMGYGQAQQGMDLNAQIAAGQQDSDFMGKLMQLGMTGALIYATGGAAAPEAAAMDAGVAGADMSATEYAGAATESSTASGVGSGAGWS